MKEQDKNTLVVFVSTSIVIFGVNYFFIAPFLDIFNAKYGTFHIILLFILFFITFAMGENINNFWSSNRLNVKRYDERKAESNDTALNILKKKLANDEISEEEFKNKKKLIE